METARTVRSRTILALAALPLLSGRLLVQGPVAPSHRSPLWGQIVPHPESLSGLWEAPDGHGGTVGLDLQLVTTAPADITTLRGVTQTWVSWQIGVHQNKEATVEFGEGSFFLDSSPESNIRFDQGRLTLHFASPRAGVPAVDLDLVQQPGNAWEGRVHRGGFDSRLRLLRPGVGQRTPVDPLVGTWLGSPEIVSPDRYCIHVAQQTATEWTGWVDYLWIDGNMQYGPHLSRPATVPERYGELIKVQRKKDHSVFFDLTAYSGLCCSHTFTGTLNAAGTLLKGTRDLGPNQFWHPGSWRKMKGDSCIDPGH